MTKSFKTTLNKFNSPLWGYHALVPTEISAHFLSQDIKRLLCKVNGELEFPCALMPKGDGQYFININKEIRTKLHIQKGEELAIELRQDNSKYGLPIPEEMEVLLEQDPEANTLFHALTAGKQRSLLFIIAKPKTSAIKLNKALGVCEYLKSTGGKLNFPELNAFLKNFRKMI